MTYNIYDLVFFFDELYICNIKRKEQCEEQYIFRLLLVENSKIRFNFNENMDIRYIVMYINVITVKELYLFKK